MEKKKKLCYTDVFLQCSLLDISPSTIDRKKDKEDKERGTRKKKEKEEA